jgi:hypothetical protein
MRNPPLMTLTFLGLALSLSVAACDDKDDADTMGDGDSETGDGDGDTGDGDPGDGDGDTGECYNQPPECEVFVRCIGALVPSQLEGVEQMYGAEGSCWCGTEDAAQGCYATCLSEVAKALESSPTESQCHDSVCGIEDLDPDQPYGPIMGGACTPYISEQGEPIDQVPFMNPIGDRSSTASHAATSTRRSSAERNASAGPRANRRAPPTARATCAASVPSSKLFSRPGNRAEFG